MKNSLLNITGLVVLIATLATFICSATVCAETQKKFAYNRTDNSEVVYSWDESQQYLTPELKYEFKRDKEGTLIEKKAYRWDIFEKNWKPYYLMTFHHKGYEHSIELARWMKYSHTQLIIGILQMPHGSKTNIYFYRNIWQTQPQIINN